MQTIVHRTEQATRELGIHARIALDNIIAAVAQRAREQRGQTAAEYMGILLVVAVIIGAVATSGIGDKISGFANGLIDEINGGSKKAPGGN